MACSVHLLGGCNPGRALLRVTHTRENLYHFPEVCNQCSNAYCARVCPVKAISRDDSTGAVTVDRETCVGCGMCSQYCPTKMIRVDPDLKKSVKCDLCGGDPECVKACPAGTLELCHKEDRQ